MNERFLYWSGIAAVVGAGVAAFNRNWGLAALAVGTWLGVRELSKEAKPK